MANSYIGSTRYVPSTARLTRCFGYNGDTAYVVDDVTRKVLSEWTKRNGRWVRVKTGSGGGGHDIDELAEKVEQNTKDIDDISIELSELENTASQKFNSIDGDIADIKEELGHIEDVTDDVNALKETTAEHTEAIAELISQVSINKDKIEDIQSAYIKSVSVDEETGDILFTKENDEVISLKQIEDEAIPLDVLESMWRD